ncbi:uncharacterized protein LOC122399028 [Colletes gigas]|uniref:uncharacterized protein LOC122399028 n=1 Tax=Colletes gigas TaxID=935657 RepID=UPI001C9B95F8|nr:uncharacterized protein LOC122399028 [Colletes gigas]XP_043255277.1 uncharacterized protein LOC122399028 [Colletes gigas]XP_043255279.1 uncharacterized protein LOC122399028 [Colletes gigas]XP_043255280.1 uncharacterized protein LOC122399028 [Colletes gigas]
MDNLEEQCEDALFELCDARERYPQRCANELKTSFQLINDIHMLKAYEKLNNISDKPSAVEQSTHNINFNEKEMSFEHLDYKLQDIANKLNNLEAVRKQVEREKICKINKQLEN